MYLTNSLFSLTNLSFSKANKKQTTSGFLPSHFLSVETGVEMPTLADFVPELKVDGGLEPVPYGYITDALLY
jgi:hypothetical protein